MCLHAWNKMVAVSSALAAAGILACVAVLLDLFMPSGSPLGFLASLALVGLIVAAVVVGYTWICDKWERYVSEGLDQLLIIGKPVHNPRAVASPRGPELEEFDSRAATLDAPRPLIPRGRYPLTLHGYASPEDARKAATAHLWCGQ